MATNGKKPKTDDVLVGVDMSRVIAARLFATFEVPNRQMNNGIKMNTAYMVDRSYDSDPKCFMFIGDNFPYPRENFRVAKAVEDETVE